MPPVFSDAAAALLDRTRIARLATADLKGRPHVVPLCYARNGDVIYFIVDEKRKAPGRRLKRLRNIAENPQVSLVADHYDEDWTRLEFVIVHGHAQQVEDEDEFDRGLVLLRARYPQYLQMRLERERNPLLRITATSMHHWRAA